MMNIHKHSNAIDDNNDTTIVSSSYALHEMLFIKKRNVNILTLKLYLQLSPESVMMPYRCYRDTNNSCHQKRQKKEVNTNVIKEKGIDHDDKSVVVLTTLDVDEEKYIHINNKLPLQIALEYCTSDYSVVYSIWEVYRDQVILLQQQREENKHLMNKYTTINGILHISCRNSILHSNFIIDYITMFPYSVQEYYSNDDETNMLQLLPLHIACQYNAPLRIIRKLVEIYPIAISLYTTEIYNRSKTQTNEIVIQHLTPLMIAIQNQSCDFNVIEFLLHFTKNENSNRINVLFQKDSLYGQTPLHMACSYRHHPINTSTTSLSSTVSNNDNNYNINMNHYIATLIATTCPNTVQIEDNCGNLPIHSLCISIRNIDNIDNIFNIEVFHTLIRQYPNSLFHMNHEGYTPLLLLLLKQQKTKNWYHNNNHNITSSKSSTILYQLVQLFYTINPSILSMKHPNTGRLPLHFLCDMITTTTDHDDVITDTNIYSNNSNNNKNIRCNNNDWKGYMILLEHFIKVYPDALFVQDHINGDLPIHILLRNRNTKLIDIPKVFLTYVPSIVYTMNNELIIPLYYICEYYNNNYNTSSGGQQQNGTANTNNILHHDTIHDDIRKKIMDKRLIDTMKIYNTKHQSRQSVVRNDDDDDDDDDDDGRIDNININNFYTSTNNSNNTTSSNDDDERRRIILQQQERVYQDYLEQQQKENDQLLIHQLDLIYNMVRKCPDIVCN